MGRTRIKIDSDLHNATVAFLQEQTARVTGTVPEQIPAVDAYKINRSFQLLRNKLNAPPPPPAPPTSESITFIGVDVSASTDDTALALVTV